VLPAKLYYLEQLKDGPVSHRTITKRMTGKYRDSAAGIKDALVAEGMIVCVKKVPQANGKYNYHHQLTGKTIVAQKQQENSDQWDDGQAKSTGNAFDWRGPSVVFKKQELAQLQQKYQGNNPITIYSRA
jgi:hypothetical protein